jgi:hypothetical protein
MGRIARDWIAAGCTLIIWPGTGQLQQGRYARGTVFAIWAGLTVVGWFAADRLGVPRALVAAEALLLLTWSTWDALVWRSPAAHAEMGDVTG